MVVFCPEAYTPILLRLDGCPVHLLSTCDGRGVRVEDLNWFKSRYDRHVHAFPRKQRSNAHAEAVCTHTIPKDRILRSEDGRKCLACLLIVGDRLAERQGSVSWRL